MDFSDFIPSSASDVFGSLVDGASSPTLGSGLYGTDNASLSDLLGGQGYAAPDLSTLADVGAGAMGGGSDGVTGIGWIDKILNQVGDGFNKDPLGTIAAGIGILSKIHAMNAGSGGAATGDMSKLISNHLGSGQGGGSVTPKALPVPAGASPSALIAIPQIQAKYVGPLTQTQYPGRK